MFQPIGVVRSEKSAKALLKSVKCDLDHIYIADVTTLKKDDTIPAVLEGSKAMVSSYGLNIFFIKIPIF